MVIESLPVIFIFKDSSTLLLLLHPVNQRCWYCHQADGCEDADDGDDDVEGADDEGARLQGGAPATVSNHLGQKYLL